MLSPDLGSASLAATSGTDQLEGSTGSRLFFVEIDGDQPHEKGNGCLFRV